MKKFDISQATSLLANIGVIASIAFLAIQLRQNNELLTVQARANTISARNRANELIVESTSLPTIYAKVRAGETLEADEAIRLKAMHQYLLLMMQWNFEDYTALGLDPLAHAARFATHIRRQLPYTRISPDLGNVETDRPGGLRAIH